MAMQQLANKAAPAAAAYFSARMPTQAYHQSNGAIGSGCMGAGHIFGEIPLFAGQLGDAGAHGDGGTPADAGAGAPIGATRDAGSDAGAPSDAGTADAGSPPDAGTATDAGTGDAGDAGATGDGGQTQPAAACTINHRTAVHAPDGTPDTRTTIGVCETVLFDIGGQPAEWSANNGWPGSRPARPRFGWAAPELPGTSTITARLPATGQTCTIDLDVIAPQTIRFVSIGMLPTTLPPGTVGGLAGADMFIGPRNVNFGWIGIHEDAGPATNVTGYFTRFTAAQLAHAPSAGFQRIDFNNHQQDTIGVNAPLPGPFTAGTWDWVIPNRYQCFNSSGRGHFIRNVTEQFRMTAGGAFHVRKGGAGF